MKPESILVLSILLQFTATVLALRLTLITGWHKAWLFMAIAVLLMTLRRLVTLLTDGSAESLTIAEGIALVTSLLMLLGMAALSRTYQTLQTETAIRQRTDNYLARLSACFLDFGPDSAQNIQHLTDLCGELMGATCALYNRLDQGLLCTLSAWNPPPGYHPVDSPQGHICFDVIQRNGLHPLVVRDLQHSSYAETDPNVRPYALQTYIGQAVKLQGQPVGSLCVVYQQDVVPTDSDHRVMEIIAQALGIEEERLQIDRARKESEARYRRLAENAPDIIYRFDVFPKRKYDYINPAVTTITGYTPEDFYADPEIAYKIIHPDDLNRFQDYVCENKGYAPVEFRWNHKNGGVVWLEQRNIHICDEAGRVIAIEGIARDITARKAAEQALQETHHLLEHRVIERTAELQAANERLRLFEAVVAHSSEAIVIGLPGGRPIYANQACKDLFGIAFDDTDLSNCQRHYPPETLEKFQTVIMPALQRGESWQGELEIVNASGQRIPIWERADAIRDEDGTMLYALGLMHDITARREAEQALRESEEKFRSVIQQSEDGIVLVDETGAIVEWNWGQERITGLKREEVINRPAWDARFAVMVDEEKTPERYEQVRARLLDFLETGDAPWLNRLFEGPIRRTDGTRRVIQTLVFPIRHQRGVVLGSISRDITDQKTAEEQLRFTQFAIDHAGDSIFWMNSEGRYIYANQAACQLTGYSHDDLIGMNIDDLAPDFRPSGGDLLSALKQRGSMTAEMVFRCQGGHRVPVEVTGSYLEFNGQAYVCGFVRDITERKLAKAALHGSAERYRMISELISDYAFAYRLGPDGTVETEWVTEAAYRITGLTPNEFAASERPHELVHPEDKERLGLLYKTVHELGQPASEEYRIITPQGQLRWLRGYWRPIWDAAEGRVVRVYGAVQDITDRKQAEQAVRASEATKSAIIAAMPDLIFRISAEGRYIEAYTSQPDLLAAPADELIGKTYDDVLPPDVAALAHSYTRQALLTGQVQALEYQLDLDIGRRDFEARLAVSELGEILAIVRDITERKDAERALEVQHAFLRQVIDSSPNLIFVKDRAGRYTLVNQAMAERHNTTIDALIGKTDSEINPNQAEVERYRATDRRVLAAQEPVFITEEKLVYPGTGETHWFQTTKMPLRGPDGSVSQLLGVATDITARKDAEQRTLELALERERSQLLGDFILATTHEFGNPLSVMKTSLYMLDRIARQDDQQHLIQMISKQAASIERLVEGLLTMSRLDRGEAFLFQRLNLDEVLGDVRDFTRPKSLAKKQHLLFDLALNLPPMRADRVQLFRALINLVENAIAYTHDGGAVTVRSGQHGDWAIVEVQDTGMGIAQAELERVFARFYRVDEARTERGAGLGLPIARKIIDRHGGRIEVESVPGQGSIFRVFLPINGD